MLNEELQVAIL